MGIIDFIILVYIKTRGEEKHLLSVIFVVLSLCLVAGCVC